METNHTPAPVVNIPIRIYTDKYKGRLEARMILDPVYIGFAWGPSHLAPGCYNTRAMRS